MATLRDIRRKITAVKKTQQITRAMSMVAATKLKRTRTRSEKFTPYAEKFRDVLGNLSSLIDPNIHPLMVKRDNVSKVELLHFTADRGLCGSFNINNILMGEKWVNEQKKLGREYGINLIGRKGRDYFQKRGFNIITTHTHLYGSVDISFINNMTMDFITRYIDHDMDELYMIYARFINMGRQEPTLVKLIPIEPFHKEMSIEKKATEYLCEPSAEGLLTELLPKHISVQIFDAFLQNEVSEYAARMAAMDNAASNCKELVQDLTLIYNKARQAAITAELMDIVGGAEAVKKA
jgi:F-type H+-transporting ATPase subunit gamma